MELRQIQYYRSANLAKKLNKNRSDRVCEKKKWLFKFCKKKKKTF